MWIARLNTINFARNFKLFGNSIKIERNRDNWEVVGDKKEKGERKQKKTEREREQEGVELRGKKTDRGWVRGKNIWFTVFQINSCK